MGNNSNSGLKKATTEKQFRAEQRCAIKKAAKDIEKQLLQKLEKAFTSGAIPEDWKTQGNQLTAKAVLDSFCRDRPYLFISKDYRKISDNLHLFI